MKAHPRFAEHLFTVVALLFYTGGPLPVILSGGRSEGLATTPPDFALVKICFQLIYVITLFYLASHWKRAAYLLLKDKLVLLLMTVIFLSIIWSVDTSMTINRSIAAFGTTLFGIYFATRYSLKQQLHILGWVLGIASFMSIIFAVALPQYGVMQGIHAGAWRGIYTHKNGLGGIMALSAITFLILATINKRKSLLLRSGILISVLLLLLSRSSSPLIYLVLLTLAFFGSQGFRWKYKSRLLAVSLFTAFAYVLALWGIAQAEAIANMFGKDLTFTGRTELWDFAWEMIQKRPFFGYGYGALWADWDSETGIIWRVLGWEAPNAHNGFLEIWLGLGFLGFSVIVTHIITSFMTTLTLVSRQAEKAEAFFLPLILILLTLLNNITESSLVDRNSIYWVLYVSATLSLKLKSNINQGAELYHGYEQKS